MSLKTLVLIFFPMAIFAQSSNYVEKTYYEVQLKIKDAQQLPLLQIIIKLQLLKSIKILK